jgi:hypothetical protein
MSKLCTARWRSAAIPLMSGACEQADSTLSWTAQSVIFTGNQLPLDHFVLFVVLTRSPIFFGLKTPVLLISSNTSRQCVNSNKFRADL